MWEINCSFKLTTMKTIGKIMIFVLLFTFFIGGVLLAVIGEYGLAFLVCVVWIITFSESRKGLKDEKAAEEKVLKYPLHPIFSNRQNYKLLDKKIIVWLDLRDSTEYDNCKQEKYFFVGQGLHVTSITPSNDPDDVKIVTIETSIGQWNPKVLPNLVEALHIIDGLVTRNTEQGVVGYLAVNILFVDHDSKVKALALQQTLSYYGVDDYRVYKRNLNEINIAKNQFLYMKHKLNHSRNEYGMITSIYDWDH